MAIFVEVFGWIGSVAVLLAYALISTNRLNSRSVLYQIMNLGGSICLIMNTVYYKAYPSTLVNGVWSLIALLALIRISRSMSRVQAE